MVDSEYLTWDSCLRLYNDLQAKDYWKDFATALLSLIERIRQDTTFPEVTRGTSMHLLSLGLPNDHFTSRWLHVRIGWRQPDNYSLALTFAGYENTVVPSSKIIPAIKYYLARIEELQNTFFKEERPRSKRAKSDEQWDEEDLILRLSEIPQEWQGEAVFNAILENTDDVFVAEWKIKRSEQSTVVSNAEDAERFYTRLLNIRTIVDTARTIEVDRRSKTLLEELENTP